MGFLDTSATTSSTANASPATVAAVQGAVVRTTTAISNNTQAAVNSVLGTVNGVSAKVSSLTKSISNAEASISKAISSVASTFNTDISSLAKSIDSAIGDVFGNTNVPSASTTATKISDPTTTNLTAPKSTSFKLSSLETGSQAVSMTGATSTFGSLSSMMTGVNLSTVLNRYNLSSVNNLASTLGNANGGSSITSLFSDLSKVANVVSKTVNTVNATINTATTTVNKISNTVTASVLGVVNNVKKIENAISNDIAVFKGLTNNLSSAMGGMDVSNYYLPGNSSTPTLMTPTGSLVNTNGSGVDSIVANAILGLFNSAGCATPISSYSSYKNQASLFHAALTTAANNGMTSLIQSMVGCTTASTPLGQQALANAFTTSAATQIDSAAAILGSIASPAALSTVELTRAISTNPNLTASDFATVDQIMSSLNTTPAAAFSVPGASSSNYPVIDLSIATNASPSYMSVALQDSTINDYLNGYQMTPGIDGSLVCII